MSKVLTIDPTQLSSIIEIELLSEPNYTFDIQIGDYVFTFTFRTFVDGSTVLNILRDGDEICFNAPINRYFQNLLFYSEDKGDVIFFARNTSASMGDATYLNLSSDDIRLFYGTF